MKKRKPHVNKVRPPNQKQYTHMPESAHTTLPRSIDAASRIYTCSRQDIYFQ